MPAIQLARLKKQSAQLSDYFYQPERFVPHLRDMLDFYADHAHRPGQAGEPPPIIQAYHVPSPVLRQVMKDLTLYISIDPQAALALSDELWGQPIFECRHLAASILGSIPATHHEPILERIRNWIASEKEDALIEALLTSGLSRLRKESSGMYISLAEEWLNNPEQGVQSLGIRALRILTLDPAFDNLPHLFRLLTALVRDPSPELSQDLVSLLRELAGRSPQETAYFLQQNLESSVQVNTAWLIRQVLRDFPLDIQQRLRAELENVRREP